MTSHSPQRWDVWHARFDFVERKGYKYRPVVVIDVEGDTAIIAVMVTGAASKLALPHDYAILDWEKAGLDKPSIARADKIARIPLAFIGTAGLIGRLSPRDTEGLARELEQIEGRPHP